LKALARAKRRRGRDAAVAAGRGQNFDDLYNVASEIAEMEETDFLGAADRLLSRWGRYDEEGA
jgi:hypothetical protein